ncbi:2'-5' RNA ligase superfamily-domain containing protein [Nitzschia inconspicua]|uniref:2'-5' RNA ligase superfamily-domain containing protein n=1 Tax=Nitzschia inconspicua TaxID=303405 RepID=A0A9K3KWH9_9STRA|nr:2'-5' RNA ligase superfamily-domain containing protein [Nitzschia inconspicua]
MRITRTSFALYWTFSVTIKESIGFSFHLSSTSCPSFASSRYCQSAVELSFGYSTDSSYPFHGIAFTSFASGSTRNIRYNRRMRSTVSCDNLDGMEKERNDTTLTDPTMTEDTAVSVSVPSNAAVSSKDVNPKKLHTVTVCMVPPPENVHVWETVSQLRHQLRDPGFFRWPPHVNLLYPFLQLDREASWEGKDSEWTLDDIVQRLEAATATVPPFHVHLNRFGTFGATNRGVLWLHPDSTPVVVGECVDVASTARSPPLIALQDSLENAFPMCRDQSQKGEQGRFVPHMTVSHFLSRDEALKAQETVQHILDSSSSSDLIFLMDRIYLLERTGDDGQFLRVAEIALGTSVQSALEGSSTVKTSILEPPQPFPDMPNVEDDWVYAERMKMKERRRKGNRRSKRRDRGSN